VLLEGLPSWTILAITRPQFEKTLRALRIKYPQQRTLGHLRTPHQYNSQKCLSNELASAFDDADSVIISQIARLELLSPEERLNPEKLMADLRSSGKEASYLPDVEAIVNHVAKSAQGGHVICVFSNGGFGGSTANCWNACVASSIRPAQPLSP